MTEHTPKKLMQEGTAGGPGDRTPGAWEMNVSAGEDGRLIAVNMYPEGGDRSDVLVATFNTENPYWRGDINFCSAANRDWKPGEGAVKALHLKRCLRALQLAIARIDDDEFGKVLMAAVENEPNPYLDEK
jgi:hypothetical protein